MNNPAQGFKYMYLKSIKKWLNKCIHYIKLEHVSGINYKPFDKADLTLFILHSRGFIKGWAPGKLTSCELDLAINLPGFFHLLFLLSFLRKTKNAWQKSPTDLLHKNLMNPLTVLSVRSEVGVSLLLAPARADKRGPKAPFPLVENAGIQPAIRKRVPSGAPARAWSYWKHCQFLKWHAYFSFFTLPVFGNIYGEIWSHFVNFKTALSRVDIVMWYLIVLHVEYRFCVLYGW